MRNWKKALRQAVAYQLCADYALVAMPFGTAVHVHHFKDHFEREGIGLMAVRMLGDVRVLVEPSLSARKMPTLADSIFHDVESGSPKPKSMRKLRNPLALSRDAIVTLESLFPRQID